MSSWGFWEWVAYAMLLVAALILAADQGLKLAPDLMSKMTSIVSSPIWAFAPLGLILVATGILVGREFGWLGASKAPTSMETSFQKWPDPYTPITVFGKKFRNESVKLDGYSYMDCDFFNVTFVYNGTTAIQFVHNNVYGVPAFHSDNPAVSGTMAMAKAFQLMKDNVRVELPPGNTIGDPLKEPNTR